MCSVSFDFSNTERIRSYREAARRLWLQTLLYHLNIRATSLQHCISLAESAIFVASYRFRLPGLCDINNDTGRFETRLIPLSTCVVIVKITRHSKCDSREISRRGR